MTTTLVLLLGIMAVVIGWIVRQTINVEPWVEQRIVLDDRSGDGLPVPSVKLGLAVFLAVATSLFALSISAYLMRMEGADWRSLAPPTMLWFNTALLIAGSVFFQRARSAAESDRGDDVKVGLLAGGAFTLAFLAGQLAAWQELNAAGYYLTTNPANAFFYLLTALHGLHLLGGLWVWARTTYKVQRGAKVEEIRFSVELCTIYWHFLLVIWVALFGLLLFT